MNVLEILQAKLKELGADGLASDECGCGIDDLQPCENGCMDCAPAKRVHDNYNGDIIFVEMAAAHKYRAAPFPQTSPGAAP